MSHPVSVDKKFNDTSLVAPPRFEFPQDHLLRVVYSCPIQQLCIRKEV